MNASLQHQRQVGERTFGATVSLLCWAVAGMSTLPSLKQFASQGVTHVIRSAGATRQMLCVSDSRLLGSSVVGAAKKWWNVMVQHQLHSTVLIVETAVLFKRFIVVEMRALSFLNLFAVRSAVTEDHVAGTMMPQLFQHQALAVAIVRNVQVVESCLALQEVLIRMANAVYHHSKQCYHHSNPCYHYSKPY